MVRTVAKVALGIFVLAATCGTAELFDRNDGPGSGLGTMATAHRAVAEWTPLGHHAVHWTKLVVAGAVLNHVRAGLAAVHFRITGDMALTTFVAYAASLGAFSPGAEFSDTTVNRAMLSFTVSFRREGRAWLAFEPGLGGNLAGTGLLAGAARLGTTAVVGPLSDNTVDRARINVAFASLL